MAGLLTFGNIYYKCGRSAVQGGGPLSSIENSISLHTSKLWWTVQVPYHEKSKQAMLEDKRDTLRKTNEEIAAGIRSIYDKGNIIGRAEMVFGRQGWTNNTAWVARYPELPQIFGDGFMNEEACPWNQAFTSIQHNYSDVPSYKTFHIHGRNKLSNFEDQKAFLPNTMTYIVPVPTHAQRETTPKQEWAGAIRNNEECGFFI